MTAVGSRVTLTPKEAADALGIGERTLRDWTAAGFVPSIKRGSIRLYSVRALERWAEEASVYDLAAPRGMAFGAVGRENGCQNGCQPEASPS